MKKVLWAILLITFIAYGMLVWSWIQEGNREFNQARIERAKGL